MSAAASQQQPHAARKLVDIAQKARGRTPLKYELEIIPHFAGELPSGLEKVSFVWERGAKVFITDAVQVNPHTRAAFWTQFLRQTATLYRENGRLLPKEYSFKVQHVRGSGTAAVRKTIGKVKIDMSQFCMDGITTSVPQEVFLQLKPACKLKVSVRATWLKDAKVDLDALTEQSFSTHRSGGEPGAPGDEDEQDLSGFDPVEMHEPPQHHTGHHRTHSSGNGASGQQQSTSSPRSAAAAAAAAGGGPGRLSKMAASSGGSSLPAAVPSSPRIAALGVQHKPGMIPAFAVPLSPEEQRAALEQEKARLAAFQQAELVRMRATIEDQLRGEMSNALAAHSRPGWRDCFCCCFPRREVRMRSAAEMALRGDSQNKLMNVPPGYEL